MSLGSRFDAWRRAERLTYAQLGRRYGVDLQTVYRHCLPPGARHHRVPRPALMVRIYEVTGGAVRPDHFYALEASA